MQGAAILATRDFRIGIPGLLPCAVFGKCDDAMQLRIEALEPGQVHLRELRWLHLTRAQQLRELRHRSKGKFLEVAWSRHHGRAGTYGCSSGFRRQLLARRHGIEDGRWKDRHVERHLM